MGKFHFILIVHNNIYYVVVDPRGGQETHTHHLPQPCKINHRPNVAAKIFAPSPASVISTAVRYSVIETESFQQNLIKIKILSQDHKYQIGLK